MRRIILIKHNQESGDGGAFQQGYHPGQKPERPNSLTDAEPGGRKSRDAGCDPHKKDGVLACVPGHMPQVNHQKRELQQPRGEPQNADKTLVLFKVTAFIGLAQARVRARLLFSPDKGRGHTDHLLIMLSVRSRERSIVVSVMYYHK